MRPQPLAQSPRACGRPRVVGLLVHSLSPHQGTIITAVRAICAEVGAHLLVRHTSPDHPGREQVRGFLAAGADTVVVAGGDGTVRQAVGVLVEAPPHCTLGVIAAGSGNVLASSLGLRRGSLTGRARIAVLGDLVDIDVGSASCIDERGDSVAGQPFCTMVGTGRDAMAVRATTRGTKRVLGPLAYGIAGLPQLARPGLRLSWRVDDELWHRGRYWSILATNTPVVPGGIVLANAARMDDGLLDVVAVRPSNPGHWLGIAAAGTINPAIATHGLQRGQGHRVELRADQPVPVQADGDVICRDAVEMTAEVSGQVSVHVGDPRLG